VTKVSAARHAGRQVPTQGDDAVAAERGIEDVEKLRRAIGIPEQLRELGVERSQLPEFAKKAFGIKRLMLLNGRLPTEADLLAILEAAF